MPPCHLTDPNVVVIGCSFWSVGRLLGATPCSCYRDSRCRPGSLSAENGPIVFDKQAMPNRETTSSDNTYLEHRLFGAPSQSTLPAHTGQKTPDGLFSPSGQKVTFLSPSACRTSP